MRNRFYGKTWIVWVQLLVAGGLGLFSVPMGIAFWTGALLDAQDQPATDAGPPLTFIGTALCVVALMALARIIHLRQPVLRLFREGIEARIVGASGLFGMPLAPAVPLIGQAIGLIELVWAIVSLRGFKVQGCRFPWETITRIEVEGVPMHRWIIIEGNIQGRPTLQRLKLVDAYFVEPLVIIAQSLRRGQADVNFNKTLESWSVGV